ncbi:hypothetical protein ACHAXR_004093 [Thalassiosira sp. AJA248-18]
MVRLLATQDDSNIHHNKPTHTNHNLEGDDNTSTNSNDTQLPKHAIHTAIITTGIQPDATFLLNQLQSHIISKYWFRYDTLLPPTIMVKMVRDVLLDCLGYDWGDEANSGKVSGGIGSAAPSYGDNNDEHDDDNEGGSSRAGRPLGVCTFLLGLDSTTKAATTATSHQQHPPLLTVIKANGASQQYVAHAMGMGSQLANEKLSQKWSRCMSREEAKDMMHGILIDVAKERGWLLDDDGESATTGGNINGLTVACETVTSTGIDIEFIPL